MSLASQSRDSGAVWRWMMNPAKLSAIDASSPVCAGQRFDVGDRLGDDVHLAFVGAAALQQRERLVGGGRDHGAELVEHAGPQRGPVGLGFDGAGVDVVEDHRGDGLGLVGHDVDVGAPQHDGALADGVGEADGDELTVAVGAWASGRCARPHR